VFLRRVVEKEHLVSDPEFGERAPQAPSFLASLRSLLFGHPSAEDVPKAKPAEVDDQPIPRDVLRSIEALKGALQVTRAGQGYVLAISITCADPARAARLSNAVADAFLVDKLDTRFEAAKRASAWLSDRLVELRSQLRESEEAVTRFRTEH